MKLAKLIAEAETGIAANVSVAEALRFRRDQYGLTQSQFAVVLGLAASHYSEIERGKRLLSLRAMRRAYAVGVPAKVLLQTPPPERAGGKEGETR